MVTTTGGGPMIDKGFAVVPDAPGLGVEVVESVVREHLRPGRRVLRPDATVGQAARQRQTVELTRTADRTEE